MTCSPMDRRSRAASGRAVTTRTVSSRSAADFIPANATLPRLRAASKDCRGCDLWKVGTQTVFGEGPRRARIMFVGEQPGDAEDKAGRPFVGPAGKLLDRALDVAGIDRDDVYVTNAVKHFKWAREARSTRRLHKTPNAGEVRACRPWLEHEIAIVQPAIIVPLGATAAKSLLGKTFSVTRSRGVPVKTDLAAVAIATVHPSSVLRAPSDQRARAEQAFVADIRRVARELTKLGRREARTEAPRRKFLPVWSKHDEPSGISNALTRSSRK
jgi:uracil-DNA glycosylase family protein